MIRAWRLTRRRFADLNGEGARLAGGRWNSPGYPLVYLADHPALAVLEVRARLDVPLSILPDDHVLLAVDLPDDQQAVERMPDLASDVGDAWLASARSAVLRVPSVMVPRTSNFLLNPLHPRAAEARIVETILFRFDPRLWSGIR